MYLVAVPSLKVPSFLCGHPLRLMVREDFTEFSRCEFSGSYFTFLLWLFSHFGPSYHAMNKYPVLN